MGFREENWVSSHAHVKISWLKHKFYKKHLELQQPIVLISFSPPFRFKIHETTNPTSSSDNKISPAVLFIIVFLAVLFFISGLLHLLVRLLTKYHSSSNSTQSNRYPNGSTSDTLQRKIQQISLKNYLKLFK